MMRFAFIFVLGASMFAADIYVDQNYGLITPPGGTPGRSITNAFKEFWKATTNAAGGDRVIIAPGSVIPRNDWFKSYPGLTASDKVLFWADAWNISGFTNASGTKLPPAGVYFTNKTNGWDVAGIADDTLDMAGYSNVAFHGIYFHNQGGGRGIKANGNSRRFYITNIVATSDTAYALDFNNNVPDGFYMAADGCNLINTSASGSGVNGLSFLWSANTAIDYDMESVTVNNLFVSYRDYAAGGFHSASGAGAAGGWRSTNDTFWGKSGMVTGGSSTNNIPYIFDSCLIENTTTINNTGQVRVFRTTFNGPAVAKLVLNDPANGIYTNDMAAFMFNFDHGLSVGLGIDGWLKPLRDNPAFATGLTNGLPVDYYAKSRPSVVTRGAAEPVKLPFSGRAH